jgi:hypothetical protein
VQDPEGRTAVEDGHKRRLQADNMRWRRTKSEYCRLTMFSKKIFQAHNVPRRGDVKLTILALTMIKKTGKKLKITGLQYDLKKE